MYPPKQPEIDFVPIDFQPIETQPNKSMLSRGWDLISQPLWTAPAEAAAAKADYLTNPVLNESPYWAMTKGLAAGSLEGLGNVVSGFSSPINLATVGLTGGSSIAARAGLPAIAKALSIGGKAAAAPMIAHGAGEVLSPESTLGERGFGLAEMAGGGAAMFHTPFAKPKPKVIETAPVEKISTPGETVRVERFRNMSDDELASAWVGANNNKVMLQKMGEPVGELLGRDLDIIKQEIQRRDVPSTKTPSIGIKGKFDASLTSVEGVQQAFRDGKISDSDALDLIQKIIKRDAEAAKPATSKPTVISKLPKFEETAQEIDLNFKTKSGRTIKELIDANRFYREQVKKLRERAKGELSGVGPIHQALQQAEKSSKAAGIRLSVGRKEAINAMGPEVTTFTGETEGPIRLVRKEKIKSPLETVREALKQGYVFIGKNDLGDMRFQKAKVPPGESMPILEEQVGTARPTAARAAKQGQTPFDAEFGMRGEPPEKPPTGPTEPPIPEGPEHVGPLADVKRNPLAEAYNFGRGTMASWDLSAPLRQGLPLIHRKEFWTSLKPMFESLRSEEAFRASQKGITERALFRPRVGPRGKQLPSFAEDAGLKLTDLTDLTKREEALMSTWAEKIPGVRASNRAYTTFLNKLRADTFESLIKDAKVIGVDGEANLPVARALAAFINNATGRGSLKFRIGLKEGRFGGDYGLDVNLEQHAVLLNSTLFAPRLIASRLRMMDPRLYIFGNSTVRKEALKSLGSIALIGNTLGQLVKMAGGDVETDPNNADFGKMKIGKVRIDPYAGFQQYIVAFNRLIRPSGAEIPGLRGGTNTGFVPLDVATGWLGQGGQSTTSSTTGREYDLWNPSPGPYDPNPLTIGGRFLRGKMHPVVGFAWSLFGGKTELSGEKMNLTTMNPMENSIMQRFIPILMQDIYELAQTDPRLLPLAVPATFGMGVQSYNWMK